MAVTITTVGDVSFAVISTADSELKTLIDSVGTDPSPLDMLQIQQKLAVFTVLVDIQATLTKTLSDTTKSVVQKSG